MAASQQTLYTAQIAARHIKVAPKRLKLILMPGAEALEPKNIRRLPAKNKGD